MEPLRAGTHTIGFIGLGNMGSPMARRLREAGFDLVVADRRDEVAASFARAHGSSAAESLEALAATSDVLVTMLPDSAAVRQVVTSVLRDGDEPVASAARWRVVIDMGSSDPAGTVALGEMLAARGVDFVDAPVSGGVVRAGTGELSILVGGDEHVAERCRPLFDVVGSSVFHVGPLGAGHAVKALNNLLSAVGLVAAAEILVAGARFGLRPDVMLDVVNASSGRNNSTETKFAPHVLTGAFASGFSLDLMLKDLRTALRVAADTNTPLPLGALLVELAAMAQQHLPEGADHTQLVEWVEAQTGTPLRAP